MQQDPPSSSAFPRVEADALPSDAPDSTQPIAGGRYQAGTVLPGGDRLYRDTLLDRTVLTKSADANTADGLEREARFVARLDHPGIPAVHDLVRNGQGALLVMRHVEGIVLATAIEDARSGLVRAELASPAVVLRMLAKVCDALSSAHARGVVHRSVRSQAITIGLHGDVVLGNWAEAMAANTRPMTLRYVSDMRPSPAHDLDDLHTDIRGVGRCLYEALSLQSYPQDAADAAAALAMVDRKLIPDRAASIIRRALTSNLTSGYRSAAELRSDLERAASELEMAAIQPARPSQRQSRVGVALAAGVGLLIGGALAVGAYLLIRPGAESETQWSAPLVTERFDDATWRNRWVPDSPEFWELRDGRMVTTGPGRALLIYRQRLTPPFAIEYTGQMLPGNRSCDLSVWWSEREGVLSEPKKFSEGARSWRIQAGAFENQYCTIMRNPGGQRMAFNPTQLVPGRDYRFRVEIDGERMSMSIDGVEIMSYRDRFPTTSGYIALYGFFPGKAFDDVSIWQKNRSGLVPATAMGDALLSFGHHMDAASAYARVAEEDGPESQQALFRKGLAERRAGRADLSRETWSLLTDADLSQAADALRLEDLFTTGQHDLFLERLQTFWRRHASGHDDLRQQWQIAVTRLVADPNTDPALLDRYLSARDQLFRDDKVSAYEATAALSYLNRYEDILRFHPDERRAYTGALGALGRVDEIERLPWAILADHIGVNFSRGNYQELLKQLEPASFSHALVLCKLGRANEVATAEFRIHPAMVHLGRVDAMLSMRPISPGIAREGLLIAGRWEEAAGAGLPDVPDSGNFWPAMVLLGRIDEAEKAYKQPLPWARLISAIEAGDQKQIAELRPKVGWPKNLSLNTTWFAGLVIGPMADRLTGQPAALESSLRRAAKEWEQVFSKRGWFLARAALGEATDEEVLAMPVAEEGQAWLTLGKALRAEMADQPAEALKAYKAYVAMPLHQRLLDNNTLDPQVECFVLWRLRALGR